MKMTHFVTKLTFSAFSVFKKCLVTLEFRKKKINKNFHLTLRSTKKKDEFSEDLQGIKLQKGNVSHICSCRQNSSRTLQSDKRQNQTFDLRTILLAGTDCY